MSTAAAPHTVADSQTCPWPELGKGLLEDVARVRSEVSALQEAARSQAHEIAELTAALKETIQEMQRLRNALDKLGTDTAVMKASQKWLWATIGAVGGVLLDRLFGG